MGADTLERAVTLAIVEDTDVVIEGVRSWVASDPHQRITVVGVGATIEDVLSGPGGAADVILLDLELGPLMVTERVGELSDAGHRVVVYSIHVESMIVEAVLAAGACAFLDKRTERTQLVETIVDVAHDRPHVTRSMAGGMLRGIRLSPREREALLLLFQGMSLTSIASRMPKPDGSGQPISPETVKQYLQRARAKLAADGRRCHSNFSLLARCIELGLIRASEVTDYQSSARSRD